MCSSAEEWLQHWNSEDSELEPEESLSAAEVPAMSSNDRATTEQLDHSLLPNDFTSGEH